MRKNATKIAAMMLSLALTVTSVNVPTTASAAAKVKLNKTKATLYVGGASSKKTTTLKATLNGKKVKATFTSNKSKVAKVAKSTGKVTAVKKGTATITAKYSGKKATCKVTVKQFVTSIEAPESVTLEEGEMLNLSELVTVKPANANNKALTYVPAESYKAGIKSDGTVLKGVEEGQTFITIKAKDGSGKTAVVNVNVTKANAPATDDPGTAETPAPSDDKEAAKIKMALENPFSTDYTNAVLVGKNAFVKVQLVDEAGNPVANKEVELTAKRNYPDGTLTTGTPLEKRISMYGNVSESVKKTDSKGYVTFVYGLDKTTDPVTGNEIDSANDKFVASFDLTATAVDNTSLNETMTVKFAAITGNTVTNALSLRNQTPEQGYAGLTPSADIGTASAVAATTGRNKENVKYVASQQVSTTGVDHKVTFNPNLGVLTLQMPGDEKTATEAERLKEEINWSTDKYYTYSEEQANTANGWVLKGVEASKLQYATVRFSKLSLSKYSRFIVRAYIVADKDNPAATTPVAPVEIDLKESESDLTGPRTESDFSVQIPIETTKAGFLYVTAQVISKGQVDTDRNEGFTVKNIEGVKKPGATNAVTLNPSTMKGLEIKWEMDSNVGYTVAQKFDQNSTGAVKAIYDELTTRYDYTDKNQFSYKVPEFPATGNAIITVRDNAGNAVAYFATPTMNRLDKDGEPENINVLLAPADAVTNMYQISEEEATRKNVGEVSQNGNDLIVDSTQSGVTHIVGTIAQNDTIKINEANSRLYTSVHWNPVTNTTVTSQNAAGIAAAAFVGQNLVIKAQLVDANGNAVTTANYPVEFYQNTDASGDKINTSKTYGDASVVKVSETTDAKGQATLILNSGSIEEVVKVFAKPSDNKFNLKYYLGDEEVTAAWVDLYWIDANLKFEPGTGGGAVVKTANATPVVTANTSPKVDENWQYEVRRSGDLKYVNGTTLNGFSNEVDITGLTIQTSVEADSVGTWSGVDSEKPSNGKARATSPKIGHTNIVNELNSASVPANSADVKFTFKGSAGSKEVKYAGVGTAMLSKKLTIDVNWGHSAPTVDFIIPTGRQADPTNGVINVYVKVTDGNANPIADRVVTLDVKGVGTPGTIPGDSQNAGTDAQTGNPTAETNGDGIATFKVTPNGAADIGKTSQLVATVSGMDEITQSSIKWIEPGEDLRIEYAEYNDTAKTITLTFNKNVSAESVGTPAMFDVEYDQDADAIFERQIVKEVVKVSGKEVVLSVPYIAAPIYNSEFTVKIITAKATNGVSYKLVGVDANKLPVNDMVDVDGYKTPGFKAGEGKKAF